MYEWKKKHEFQNLSIYHFVYLNGYIGCVLKYFFLPLHFFLNLTLIRISSKDREISL